MNYFDFFALEAILRCQPSAVKTRSWTISWSDLFFLGEGSALLF